MYRFLFALFVILTLASFPSHSANGQTTPPLLYLTLIAKNFGGGDTSPPQLVTWSFAPTSIDTSDSDQVITFTAHFTDNLSGLTDGIIGRVGVGPTQARFLSPSGQQFSDVIFQTPQHLISGTALDGIYQSTMTLPRFCETGEWQLEYLYLADDVGNVVYLERDVLSALGLLVSFSVTQ